ncbi:MAG: hypothetical protein LBI87_02575 [Candidatus Accumulibacter sp.]|jgi:uncharacterized protein YgbK (DUF1537 family)|nr:hypothetical protein [Accumulibacter sp.]
MTSIRILADDLTGALDTAAAFAGETPVFIDRPPADGRFSAARVAVVATPTRDAPSEDIPGHLRPTLEWLKSGGLAFKKVDSLLRGNTFAELAWLARNGGFGAAVFAPAFPAQGRVTLGGRQWVIAPGDLSGPRQPTAPPFAEAFSIHGLSVGADAPSGGKRRDVWAPDVTSDAELDAIAAQAGVGEARSWLWCGSAGLAHALARRFGLEPGAAAFAPPVADDAPTVLVSASHHPVFRRQWEFLCSARKPHALARRASAAELADALDSAKQGAGSVWLDLSPEDEIDPARAARLLDSQMTQLAAGLPRPGRLVVIGGDTLLGLCRAAGAEALLARAFPRGGWGHARLQGGAWDGVFCYSRSGAFGGVDDLSAMIRLLDADAGR